MKTFSPPVADWTYNINLDERGSFYADVRNSNGRTMLEVKAGNELAEDESSLVDDGYMLHLRDTSGLLEYLRSVCGFTVHSLTLVP